tara:strand:- start:1516 stop:1638 length:123 start_codon:yes stop_codon:yes gene_type:complete
MQDMSLTDGWEVILIIVDVPLPYIADSHNNKFKQGCTSFF